MGRLLSRGLIVGLLAGVLAFAFAHQFGEPQVDHAIAFEAAHEAPTSGPAEPELVSRATQSSIGLLTGVCMYGLAFGGIFALSFAAAHGRIGRFRPRVTSAILAVAGFFVVFLVPFIKYPSNPPSIGNPDTIGRRTELYLAMIAISVLAAIAAYRVGRRLVARWGGWNAGLTAIGIYLVIVIAAGVGLPSVHETPEGFSADVLWRFRTATVGIQTILWVVIGVGFGLLAERLLAARSARPAASAEEVRT